MMMAMPGPSVVDTLGFSQVMITSIWNMLAEPLKTFSAIAASEGYLPVM